MRSGTLSRILEARPVHDLYFVCEEESKLVLSLDQLRNVEEVAKFGLPDGAEARL
jgi:hypothetical protein